MKPYEYEEEVMLGVDGYIQIPKEILEKEKKREGGKIKIVYVVADKVDFLILGDVAESIQIPKVLLESAGIDKQGNIEIYLEHGKIEIVGSD